MADDLDAVVRRADPDRWASSRFIGDAERRDDIIALYAFEHELARAERVASNSLIAEIRLTWWSEALGEIEEGRPVRAHPVAHALATAVSRRGLPAADLERMIETRLSAVERAIFDPGQGLVWADGVFATSAGLAARILDERADPALAAPAGRIWGLAQLAWTGRLETAQAMSTIEADRPLARRSARRLPVAAFPAVAHATLAGRGSPPQAGEAASRRLRILLAVARGRL